MRVLAIDPGTAKSAFVVFDGRRVLEGDILDNEALLARLKPLYGIDGVTSRMAVEMVESFGMAVGREVFETVWWVGRFCQAWVSAGDFARVTRREVKLHLCGSMRAKDANVRQALIDKLGPPGTKKQPGNTYGVRSHLWSALAVAVTYAEAAK
jgi:hypothetical protein